MLKPCHELSANTNPVRECRERESDACPLDCSAILRYRIASLQGTHVTRTAVGLTVVAYRSDWPWQNTLEISKKSDTPTVVSRSD
eukprot:2799040-Prymnesium_polylepis.1